MPTIRVAEELAELVADHVVDGLEVELGGERLLDAVDDRELGGALLASPSTAAASRRRGGRFPARRPCCRRASAAGGRPNRRTHARARGRSASARRGPGRRRPAVPRRPIARPACLQWSSCRSVAASLSMSSLITRVSRVRSTWARKPTSLSGPDGTAISSPPSQLYTK